MDPVEVLGIVADTHQFLETDLTPAMYRPLAQMTNACAFLVRTKGDPIGFTKVVRAEVGAIDANQAVSDVQSLEDLMAADSGHNRPILSLFAGFAGVALMLALTGLYGVIAYTVAQRTQEVGIRRALGAQHADILRLVLGEGLSSTIAGIALGVGSGLALTRFLKSLLSRSAQPIRPPSWAWLSCFSRRLTSSPPSHADRPDRGSALGPPDRQSGQGLSALSGCGSPQTLAMN